MSGKEEEGEGLEDTNPRAAIGLTLTLTWVI